MINFAADMYNMSFSLNKMFRTKQSFNKWQKNVNYHGYILLKSHQTIN